MTDRIEKRIELNAPISRVWKAISDYREFGEWFGVKLDGPFAPGQPCTGRLVIPGYENLKFEFVVVKIEPETYFSYKWHPYAIDSNVDYSQEPHTLVEFQLEKTKDGTRLTVIETGFDKLPADRIDLAFRMNTQGWTKQLENIQTYVEKQTRVG